MDNRKIEIVFKIVDVDAKPNASATLPAQCEFSRGNQVLNDFKNPAHKLGTYEQDYFKLDGTYVIPPRQDVVDQVEIGFWSDVLSDSDCKMNVQMEITINKQIDSKGLTFTFDTQTDNYPTKIKLEAYRDDVFVMEDLITNTSSVLNYGKGITRYNKLVITFLETSKPNRRVRLTEFDFGLFHLFFDSQVISANLLEEVSTFNEIIPSNEFDFTIDNSEGVFNILNPDGIYEFLQHKQPIEVNLSDGTPMGTYYLNAWVVDEGGMTANFTGRDFMDTLRGVMFYSGVEKTATLYDLALELIQYGNVFKYRIDESLKNKSVKVCLPPLSVAELLQQLATVGQCSLYVNRANELIIEKLSDDIVGTIGFDTVYNIPKIEADDLIKTMTMPLVSYRPKGTEPDNVYEGSAILAGETSMIIQYSEPVRNHQLTVTGGTVVSVKHNSWCSELTVTGSGVCDIVVTGIALERLDQTITMETPLSLERGAYVEFSENNFATNNSVVKDTMFWLFTELNKRYKHSVGWDYNAELNCTDLVHVQDQFGTNQGARITKLELSYDGVLDGNIELRGG